MISTRCAPQGPLWSPAASNAPTCCLGQNKAHDGSISLVRKNAPHAMTAFGLTGPPATKGPNPTSSEQTCAKGSGVA
eukprot:1565571-Amphidinium_carterae.1